MPKQDRKGIAGWLAVLAALQVLSLLHHVVDLAHNLSSVGLAFSSQPIVAGWTLAGDLAMVTLALYWTLLLFRRRRAFPAVLRLQLWAAAVLHLVDFALRRMLIGPTRSMMYETGEMVGLVVAAIVLSFYTLQSVRVRNTFVT